MARFIICEALNRREGWKCKKRKYIVDIARINFD